MARLRPGVTPLKAEQAVKRMCATINRHDFGVSWNSTLDRGGVVVGNMVEITIDAEAILQDG